MPTNLIQDRSTSKAYDRFDDLRFSNYSDNVTLLNKSHTVLFHLIEFPVSRRFVNCFGNLNVVFCLICSIIHRTKTNKNNCNEIEIKKRDLN